MTGTRTDKSAESSYFYFHFLNSLKVVIKIPRVEQQDIHSVTAVQESRPAPREPDLGLEDWMVLRQRCFIRTVAPGKRWLLRSQVPTDWNAFERERALMVEIKGRAFSAQDGTGSLSAEIGRERNRNVPEQEEAIAFSPAVTVDDEEEVQLVVEYHVQRRATYWLTSVYLPLVAMELIVPMAFALPVHVRKLPCPALF